MVNIDIPPIIFSATDVCLYGFIDSLLSNADVYSDHLKIVINSNNDMEISAKNEKLTGDLAWIFARIEIFTVILKNKVIIPNQYINLLLTTLGSIQNIVQHRRFLHVQINSIAVWSSQSDVILDEIISIEKLPKNVVKVYDFTVNSTLNFILFNGLGVRDTSETGYCQRKIGKAMEDVVVRSDKVVRNAQNQIIQFVYGDDGFDAAAVEYNVITFITLTRKEVEEKYYCNPSFEDKRMTVDTLDRWKAQKKRYNYDQEIQKILNLKDELNKILLNNEVDNCCLCPVNFERLLYISSKKTTHPVDITPLETQQYVLDCWKNLLSENVLIPTLKVRALFFDHCSTVNLWNNHKLDTTALKWFLDQIYLIFISKSITSHEAVGICAAQNCSEPLTQMTLNRFHQSGQFSNLVTGVARIKEILNVTKNMCLPSMTIFPKTKNQDLQALGISLTQMYVVSLLDYWDVTIPDDGIARYMQIRSIWTKWNNVKNNDVQKIVLHLNKTICISKKISPLTVVKRMRIYLSQRRKDADYSSNFSFSSVKNTNSWWVCFSCVKTDKIWTDFEKLLQSKCKTVVSDSMVRLTLYDKLVDQCMISGCYGIEDFYLENIATSCIVNDVVVPHKQKVLFTKGSNLLTILGRNDIDSTKTITNNILEIENVLGIDAVCESIEDELRSVMAVNKAHVGSRHLQLMAHTMCFRGVISPMTYQGICHQDTSVVKKAAFEKVMESFVLGAVQGHVDQVSTAIEAITWNSILHCGTGTVTITPDSSKKVPEHISKKQLSSFANRRIEYTPPNIEHFFETELTTSVSSNLHSFKKRKSESVGSPSRKSTKVFFSQSPNKFEPSSPITDQTFEKVFFCNGNNFRPTSPVCITKTINDN